MQGPFLNKKNPKNNHQMPLQWVKEEVTPTEEISIKDQRLCAIKGEDQVMALEMVQNLNRKKALQPLEALGVT